MTAPSPGRAPTGSVRAERIALGCALASLLAFAVGIAVVSRDFLPGAELRDLPIRTVVASSVAAGLAYLVAVWALARLSTSRGLLIVVLLIGGVSRALMFGSTPILEDDAYRYLWDGSMVASGRSPYADAPSAWRDGASGAPEAGALDETARATLARVNHPDLRTIYPPVAQLAFGFAHVCAPWSLDGLRAVWSVLDVATLGMLAWAFRQSPSRNCRLAVYWLNPVLVRQVYNACHMEMLVVAFGVAAVLLARSRWPTAAAGTLALAVGAKLWPALWTPLILRAASLRYGVIRTASVAALTISIVVVPMVFAVFGRGSGVVAYVECWQMNDSGFVVLEWALRPIFAAGAERAARVAFGLIVGAVALGVAVWPLRNGRDLARRALLVASVLFLLSPTQFPWYYLWLVPLLAIVPRWSLLTLTATLPLYDLRVLFTAAGRADQFDFGVVWLEFIPSWGLLALEWLKLVPLPVPDPREEDAWRSAHASR